MTRDKSDKCTHYYLMVVFLVQLRHVILIYLDLGDIVGLGRNKHNGECLLWYSDLWC